MNEIFFLFIILGTLFIIENKSINLLALYIGMVIIIAILISIYPNLNNLNDFWNGISYISYILVLVQISALTILFGFIIMLYPKNNTEILIKDKNKNFLSYKYPNNNYFILFFYIIIGLTILYFLFNIKNIDTKVISDNFNHILYDINIMDLEDVENVENEISIFLNKISYLLYTEPSNILKFIIITIILLFAIICLFYILFPTF